jgi:hypothetical protein
MSMQMPSHQCQESIHLWHSGLLYAENLDVAPNAKVRGYLVFGLFSVFTNFHRLDLHNKTNKTRGVALVNL